MSTTYVSRIPGNRLGIGALLAATAALATAAAVYLAPAAPSPQVSASAVSQTQSVQLFDTQVEGYWPAWTAAAPRAVQWFDTQVEGYWPGN